MDANIIKEKASRKYAGCNEIQKNITLDIMERLIPKGSIEATTGELYKASIKLLEAGLGNRKSSPVTLVSQKEVYLEENKQDKTANVERDYRSKDTLSKSHRNLKEATTNKIEKEMQKEFFGLMGVDESLSKYGIGKRKG
ncbi:hypothetical protein DS742_11900 [Lacrimispora amygdalina]|uniref:Uncharacterized protein n=1 Tax=Lacrimispora amygdalina TaxID=253257 RepID=A0A3E2NCT5_9FIRM|nr:hypothetical protein [Clostridium indicum]RFZ78805.1 hypothetical protein DS742_11900 [Clostridium indicum]